MTDDTTRPPLALRLLAYAQVVVIPAVAFVVCANVSYGERVERLRGANELVDVETNERLRLPGFSLLHRLVHGYLVSPGYGMSGRRFDDFRARSGEEFDVVVFGSSHAYRSFDPRIFEEHGIGLFNLGTTEQTPMATHFLVDDLRGQLRTTVALIEVTPFQIQASNRSAYTARDLALNRDRSIDSMELALKSDDFDTTRLAASYLAAPRPRFEEVKGGIPVEAVTYCWYVEGGYCEWTREGVPSQEFRALDFLPNDEGLEYLAATVALLRQRNVEVVFVIAPMPEQMLAAGENVEVGTTAVKALADELEVPLLDYVSPDAPLKKKLRHPEHFYDSDHLNQSGVTIFNEHVISALRRRGTLQSQ